MSWEFAASPQSNMKKTNGILANMLTISTESIKMSGLEYRIKVRHTGNLVFDKMRSRWQRLVFNIY